MNLGINKMTDREILIKLLKDNFYINPKGLLTWGWQEDIGIQDRELNQVLFDFIRENNLDI